MSGFVKRTTARNVNPAGGINPAVQPNVGQYGWTSFDAANVNQLIDYVKAAREAAESAQTDAAYIKTQLANIDNTVLYFERLYNEIKPIAENIEAIYFEITRIRDKMDIQVEDVKKMHEAILVMFAEVQNILNEMRSLRDETKVYKDSAKQSETASVEAMTKSVEIYEELKKGQVYRGTWNPNSAKYPAHGDTNSVWDVVLNAGQTQVSFDSKNWFFGDRLIYVKDTAKYEQLEAGTNVKSVNGKTGSVVLEAVDVKALPITGGTLTGALNIDVGGILVRKDLAVRTTNDASTNTRMVTSGSYGYFQAGHTTDDTNQRMLLTGMSGKGLTEFQIRMVGTAQPQVRIGTNNYNLYHVGNKPTAGDVGAVARSGDTMSGPLTVPASQGIRTATQSDGTYTSLSAETGYSLMWKKNNSSTVADEFIGIKDNSLIFRRDNKTGDKKYSDFHVYHQGFKPTAADIGAMGSNGGTITGDMIMNEKLTVKKDFIVDTGNGYRMVTKSLGTIENNKASLVLFCPIATATAQGSQGFSGRINIFRGASNAYNLISWIDLTARVAYTELAATIHDQYTNRATSDTMKLVQTKHNGVDWLALFLPSTSTSVVTMEGVVTGNDPIFVASSDGYTTVDYTTMSEVVRHNRQTRALDVVDTSSTGGYKFNTKVAIGGVNDSWLRLNPSNHFSSGIYSSTGTIRHDGGLIQLKNWATATAKPVQLSIPAEDQYTASSPGIAALSVKVPASANAVRLMNVYDENGAVRASVVSRSDTSGAFSFMTHGGNTNANRVTISGGNVFAYGDQNAGDDALTKRKYVNDTFVRKTSDTMTGTLTAQDVLARLTHRNGYMNINAYNSQYQTNGSSARVYYREHDVNSPGVGWSGLRFDKFTPASGDTPSKSEGLEIMLGSNFVYHQGRKPTSTDVGAMSDESTHVNTAVDLNTYTKNGTYNLYASNAANLTNAPAGFQYGTLLVVGRGAVTHSFVTQTLTNKNNNMQWVRSRSDGVFGWSAWSAIFSEANPPKIDQIDAVLKTGDTMTGHLYMDNNADIYLRGQESNNPIIWFHDKATNKPNVAIFHDRAGDRFAINHYAADGKYSAFRMKVGEKAPTFTPTGGGTFHMYHEGFKPSAADVGAPVMNSTYKAVELQSPTSSIKGGMIRTEQDGSAQVSWVTDKPMSESYKAIGVHSVRGPVYNDGQIREIYHTGRKPVAADIDGLITRGAWGLGDKPGLAEAAEGQDYTEDKTRDFNKLITSGTYSLTGEWTNSINNTGVAQSITATIQVIARKWVAGPVVYQKLIMGIAGDGSRYAERTGSGTYPNMTWSKWKENGTYQANLEYRLTLDRAGESTYPYFTMHKRDARVGLASGYYTNGMIQFKNGPLSDANNPDSGQLVASLRADTQFDNKVNRVVLALRKAADQGVATEYVLYENKAFINAPSVELYETKSLASNSYRMAEGTIGTFWRKDSDNLYLMRTESGQARDGTWTSHRPFSMKLSDATVTIGTLLTTKAGLNVEGGPLRLTTNYLLGSSDSITLRDHGNGNVTLSAGRNSAGTAGDLYLGYNAAASGTGGYNTRQVSLRAPMNWGSSAGTHMLVEADGKINGDAIGTGAFQVLTDGSNVRHTIVGGNDTINRGRTIVASGEAGKQIADNTSTGAEDLYLASDGSIFLETAVQNGFATRKTIRMNAGEIYAADGSKRVYHQGFKPTAADLDVAPSGFGLGGSGARPDGDNCSNAVKSGFYSIFSATTNTPEGVGPSGSKMVVVAWSSQHVSQTFYRVGSNRSWTRSSLLNGSDVTWTDWAEVYTTAKKPTAAELQLVPVGDVTTTGEFGKIVRMSGSGVSDVGRYIDMHFASATNDYDIRFEVVKDAADKPQLNINGGTVKVNSDLFERGNRVYSAGFKPSAADLGVLPLTGGTLTGHLNINQGAILKFPTATYATGAQIYAQNADAYGCNLIVSSGGATVIGSGESGQAAANALADKSLPSGEKMYITSDDTISFLSGANAFASRKETLIGTDGKFTTSNDISIKDTTRGKNFTMGTGNVDTWLVNSKANKYFQMRDNGDLQYDSKHIHYVNNPNTKGSMISESQALGGTINLDDMLTPGVFHQSSNANAVSGANYPENLAGSLVIYAAAGVIQEYRIYNTSRLWRRARYNAEGGWSAWSRDYNSLNKPSAADVGALSLSAGGTVAGATVHTGTTSFVGGLAKFYNGSSTHHNIQSVGNNLHFSTGGNGETIRMAITAGGDVGIYNNLIVDNGRILNQRPVNPMVELHAPGKFASIMYINTSGELCFSQSNGGGGEVANYMRMTTNTIQTPARMLSTINTGRSWTEVGKGAFISDVSNSSVAGSGTLHCALSQYSLFPNNFHSELIVGTLFGPDFAQTSTTLTQFNATTQDRRSWFFRNNGTLEVPGGGWRIQGAGDLIGGAYGGGSIGDWCKRSFAPISDGNLKVVLGESKASALGEVAKMKFHSYVWTGEGASGDLAKRSAKVTDIGVVAQELEEINPNYARDVETFNESGEKESLKTLDTANLLAVALKAIQELSAKVESLEAQLASK